ncbi:MAG TPA: cytochrome c3 family protein [Geobacteraceae bacterium]|nr:cytochrome c3 family protein [Geobacteraceae bacterium]
MRRLIVLTCTVVFIATQAFAMVGGGDVTLKNKGGDVVMSHEAHVSGAGQKCTACHDKLYINAKQHKKVTMKQMQKGKSCGACHNGKIAFSVKGDCAKCHKK